MNKLNELIILTMKKFNENFIIQLIIQLISQSFSN